MTGSSWWDLAILLSALALAWLSLVVVLLVVRPRGGLADEAVRILPDVLRLVRRLAADPAVPVGARVRLGLLRAYLALPFDLVPDSIPVVGHADDAILATAVLRSVVRRSGVERIRAHWPGTDAGFSSLAKVTGLPTNDRRSGPDTLTL